MNLIFEAALSVGEALEKENFRYCIIGGVAVQRWGEPRLTQDVDLTLLAGFGNEAEFVDILLGLFSPRLDDARAFALRSRVVLVRAENGVPIDISLGAMPFEERAVGRASPYNIGGGRSLLTCSAEDLVVFKAFAGRDRDWVDLEGIVRRQAGGLDVDLIERELTPLLELKEDMESWPRLHALLAAD